MAGDRSQNVISAPNDIGRTMRDTTLDGSVDFIEFAPKWKERDSS